MPPFVTPDENLAAVIRAPDQVGAKMAAMRAYPTQIQVDGPFFALSNNVGDSVWAEEFFRIAKGERGPLDADGLEEDLFAGL